MITIAAPGPIPPDASPLAAPRVPTGVGELPPLRHWQRGEFWSLDGTHLELWREHGSGWWWTIDARDPDSALLDAKPLNDAKLWAIRYAENHPEVRK